MSKSNFLRAIIHARKGEGRGQGLRVFIEILLPVTHPVFTLVAQMIECAFSATILDATKFHQFLVQPCQRKTAPNVSVGQRTFGRRNGSKYLVQCKRLDCDVLQV